MKVRKFITGFLMVLWSCSPTSCTDPSKEEFIPGGESGGTEGGETTEIVWHERAYAQGRRRPQRLFPLAL